METVDKAGKSYWDSCWAGSEIPNAINPDENYINRQFHHHFTKAFAGIQTQGATLLEIGCARSQWLPYFAQQFGFKVYGLDYSALGCRQAQLILEKAGVDGSVVCADIFTPPSAMLDKFDVVISFGVAEHFENTAICIGAFARFLKPGGVLVTNIPNMTGLIGLTQRLLNRPIFDIHVPLGTYELANAHAQVDLKDIHCEYLVPLCFGVSNLNGLDPTDMRTRVKDGVLHNLSRLSQVIWWIDDHGMTIPINQLSGSFVLCVARKQ